jgi:tryptophan-rich sensory protein
MGIAAFQVWQEGGQGGEVQLALVVYAIQLALNGLWSVIFFGFRSSGPALVEISLLWVFIWITLVLFWQVTPSAGMLLLPYAAWVTFAVLLNAAIWVLNR